MDLGSLGQDLVPDPTALRGRFPESRHFTLRERRELITDGMHLRLNGLALVAGIGAGLGMDRFVCGQHVDEGGQPFTLSGMASV